MRDQAEIFLTIYKLYRKELILSMWFNFIFIMIKRLMCLYCRSNFKVGKRVIFSSGFKKNIHLCLKFV